MTPLHHPPTFSPYPSPSPPQRDGSNLYMTLHVHEVDDRTMVNYGEQTVPVPAGWQIADENVEDIHVCAAHPSQIALLVFANGNMYGTAACNPSFIGELRLRLWRRCKKIISFA